MATHRSTLAAPPAKAPCPRQGVIDSLLVAVGGGDCDAFAAFYDEMCPVVYAMSLSSGHGPAISARITLDVFVQAWQQAATFDPRTESASTWVRTIALSTINDQSDRTGSDPALRSPTPDDSPATRRRSHV